MSDQNSKDSVAGALKVESQSGHSDVTEATKSYFWKTVAEGPYNVDLVAKIAAAVASSNYALLHMVDVPRFHDRSSLLKNILKSIPPQGFVLEFGVWGGTSINTIADLLPSRQIYGFDSFEGLPEGWFGKDAGRGMFSLQGKTPDVRTNVELIPGWFDRTLPIFFEKHPNDNISFLHIDCDLYSSTQTIFATAHSRIKPGSIILFDEYLNYPGWERQEFLAFKEYTNFRSVKYEYIGLVPSAQQVAVRILS